MLGAYKKVDYISEITHQDCSFLTAPSVFSNVYFWLAIPKLKCPKVVQHIDITMRYVIIDVSYCTVTIYANIPTKQFLDNCYYKYFIILIGKTDWTLVYQVDFQDIWDMIRHLVSIYKKTLLTSSYIRWISSYSFKGKYKFWYSRNSECRYSENKR